MSIVSFHKFNYDDTIIVAVARTRSDAQNSIAAKQILLCLLQLALLFLIKISSMAYDPL